MSRRPELGQRELQVVDASAVPDVCMLACAAYLAQSPGLEQKNVFLLGTQAQRDLAGKLGLEVDSYCQAAGPFWGWHALRKHISRGQYKSVRPWSQSVVACCRVAARNLACILPVPGSSCSNDEVLSATPESYLDIGTCSGESRDAIRQRYGIVKDQPMVALLADPRWHADARRFVYMIGMLDIAEQPIAGLIDCRSAHLTRARQFHSEAAVRWNMLITEHPLCTVLHACDLAVIVPPEPHRALTLSQRTWIHWSILRAHLLGVPVVGADCWFESGMCPTDICDTLAAGRGSVTEIARTLAGLAHDTTKRMEIADRVRAYARNLVKIPVDRGNI